MTRRVHFVDDDESVLAGLRRNLRSSRDQFDAHFHADAESCLSAMEDQVGGLVVTDWMMPGMDGLGLCRELRRREAEGMGAYYVIVLTGKGQVESLVEALDSGADDYLTKPFDRRELLARIRCGYRVLEAEAELRRANRRLEALATTDMLTGLANRRHAEEILSSELDRVGRDLEHLGVLLMDIDHFKQVNDRFGHAAGDDVLREVARRLDGCCRSYDLAARWGGEEFLLICPHSAESEIRVVAERIRGAIAAEAFELADGMQLPVTISAGAAWTESGVPSGLAELVEAADRMLYLAKEGGRDRVCVQTGPIEEVDQTRSGSVTSKRAPSRPSAT